MLKAGRKKLVTIKLDYCFIPKICNFKLNYYLINITYLIDDENFD